mgnify:CR=1 FL=1
MKKSAIQPAVAKKILKANKDVGKFKKEIPQLVVSTAELFINEMIEKLAARGATKEIKIEDIIQLINSDPQYDFLMSSIPEIQACAADDKKKKKEDHAQKEENDDD